MSSSTLTPIENETVTIANTKALHWLRNFIKEINDQDNRITATPYYYDLRYHDEEGIERPVDYGQNIFFTEKSARNYIVSESHNLPKGTYEFLCWAGRNPELQKLFESIGKVVGVPYERK